MNLISLIARRPKPIDELEEMIQAIKTIASSSGTETEPDKATKLAIENFKYAMRQMGEQMQDHEIEEILADCSDLIHDGDIMIDAFANYLMSR